MTGDGPGPSVPGPSIPMKRIPSHPVERFDVVDVVRGLAIAGVVLFHVVWDLAFLGFVPAGWAYAPAWLLFGRTLAGTFMVLVGVSLVLAGRRGIRARAFARRLIIILTAALAITVVTRIAFPATFIYFGILHAIAAASVIGAIALRYPTPLVIAAGVIVVLLGNWVGDPAFDPRWLAWTGFGASPPPSNDFVPVFPWAGLTLLGIALGRVALARGWFGLFESGGTACRSLVWLGRHSLLIYLMHQPLLLAILVPLSKLL